MKRKRFWFFVALGGALLAAPNAMVMRGVVQVHDPFLVTALRFGIAALLCLPALLMVSPKKLIKARRTILIGSVAFAVSGTAYSLALQSAPASYVSVFMLLSPIVLLILAAKLSHERMNARSIAGVSLAALGAMVIVALPFVNLSEKFEFYSLATVLTLVSASLYALSCIYFRKANMTYGISMTALIAASALVAALLGTLLWLFYAGVSMQPWSPTDIGAVVFSGVVVLVISHFMTMRSYRYIGTPVMSTMGYIESLLAVLLPLIFLHEAMAPSTLIGGCLILLGVYVVEHHKSAHHKQHHVTRT